MNRSRRELQDYNVFILFYQHYNRLTAAKLQILAEEMMSAVIIDGKSIAEQIRSAIKDDVTDLKKREILPCLSVVLVGDDPASISYVTGKRKALAAAGMTDRSVHLPD